MSTIQRHVIIESAGNINRHYQIHPRYKQPGIVNVAEGFAVSFNFASDCYQFLVALGFVLGDSYGTAMAASPSDVDHDHDMFASGLGEAARIAQMGLGVVLFFPGWSLEN